jgi:hypothetical protein
MVLSQQDTSTNRTNNMAVLIKANRVEHKEKRKIARRIATWYAGCTL